MIRTAKTTIHRNRSRLALGSYTLGAAAVSAFLDNGLSIGMAINSLCALSLEPELLAWYIDRATGTDQGERPEITPNSGRSA